MAIAASAVWRCRPSGATTNGAAYDGTSYAGGVDYSQQDSAQLTLTDLAAAGSTAVVTSATGGFTANMVGNAMRIASGTNFAVGYYFIVTYTSSNQVTLDRNPGTVAATACSGGNIKVGGAYGGSGSCPFFLGDSSRATGNKVVAGNIVYILGVSGSISSPDYSWTGLAANPPVSGDTTSGAIWWIGEGSARPTMKRTDGDAIFVNGGAYLRFKNFYYQPGSASTARCFDCKNSYIFEKCVFDLNDLDTSALIDNGCVVLNCEFFSKTSGTPTSRSTAALSGTNVLNAWTIIGSHFHDLGGPAISCTSAVIQDSLFNKSVKEYVLSGSSDARSYIVIKNNTFNNTAADAVSLTSAIGVGSAVILDNIFSNNTGSGKAAVKLTGTAARNDLLKVFLDYNDYYNNTTNCTGFTIGANDLTLDPQFTSSTDFTLNGTNLQAQAYPRATITGG